MSDIPACPACRGSLSRVGRAWICQPCSQSWRERATCPSCAAELEVLKACGAVDYFCPVCNSLQSRREVIRDLCLCD